MEQVMALSVGDLFSRLASRSQATPKPGVSEAEIAAVQANLGCVFPSPLVEWFRLCNGWEIQNNQAESLGWFLSISTHLEEPTLSSIMAGAWWPRKSLIPIASDLWGNSICIDTAIAPGQGNQVRYMESTSGDLEVDMASDFHHFLLFMTYVVRRNSEDLFPDARWRKKHDPAFRRMSG
ncbi:MAG: SMI1/KNR4 family protein [Phycisphaerales bacterium]